VGGLAYAAFSRYQRQQAATPAALQDGGATVAPRIERFVPGAERADEVEALGLTLLKAMVAAARADGRLDARERQGIHQRVVSMDLSAAEKADLIAQLEEPVDMACLVAAARTPEIAAEIYTASLLAIDVDTPAERAYLALLAARLGLPEDLVDSIHRELDLDEEAAPALAAQGAGQ
jgi:uncharacterized membrane protein YebE (DUF533 family)